MRNLFNWVKSLDWKEKSSSNLCVNNKSWNERRSVFERKRSAEKKKKIALMKRYDLTEDGYRRKFRASKPEVNESPDQFIVRLTSKGGKFLKKL